MLLSRRAFGHIAASGLASAATLLAAKKIPIGVQLYSVRQIAEKDLAGVLEHIAKSGFSGVEFAGYYGHSAADVRKMLDANGLKCAGTHTPFDQLTGDNFEKTIEYNKTIGNRNIIVPGMPGKYRETLDGWKQAAAVFEEIAARIRPQGFVLGYHNHTAEFETKDGGKPFDVFFSNAKNVKVQLDLGHAARAGEDLVKRIRENPGRVISVHVKEFNPSNPEAALGDGTIDWKSVFNALETVGGTEWYILEEEGRSCQQFECIDRSLNIMKTKMKKG